ncbi:hypothetical protein, partial [Reinekea blandensis]
DRRRCTMVLKDNPTPTDPPVFTADPTEQSHAQIAYGDYQLTSLAPFELQAKILGIKNYRFGRESELSPMDLALGWNRMADDSVLESIRIRQSNRWYYWSTDRYPIPRREIETSSANMHMIPASKAILSQLKALKVGQNIRIEGRLVRADAEDGWHWVSSLTRQDTGDGACELVLLTQLEVL